ncbi:MULTISPECIES: DUF5640 domain-containing protein [Bacillus cereus group]|uniref:DUF5640 domain-containing protein n=1 Tax=Bacillus cereus group TaxID=86661 RepID=UPI0022DEA64D|nr:DUF5640 domain-containing protein [Bacillus cereus group sp. TH152-1LC]MDA1675257.1 DUF5640 domain-containing protein [Bacillus cereus group sp. TH152-1LC]
MKKSLLAISVFLLSIMLVACGGTDKELIGKWEDNLAGVSTYDFKKDGTVSAEVINDKIEGKYTADGKVITIKIGEKEIELPYSIKGDKLTVTSNGTDIEFGRVK